MTLHNRQFMQRLGSCGGNAENRFRDVFNQLVSPALLAFALSDRLYPQQKRLRP
jgi:hypothetical protein